MTIIQLEYLVAVANCGSFSLASEQCFVTQPSMSMQIKNLEEELGVILLDRSKKPVIPTEIGALVIQQAKEALKAFKSVKQSVSDIQGKISGVLRLGIIPTIAPYLLHRFIPSFMVAYPNVSIEICEMPTQQLFAEMNRDAIDAVIVAGGVHSRGVFEQELFNDTFHAYISPDNRLFERYNVSIEDIDPTELLLLSEEHCMRNQVIELCHLNPKKRSVALEAGSLETLIRLVDATSSMTIIPEMAVSCLSEKQLLQVKPFAKGATSRKISLAVRRTYVKSMLVKALRESIINAMRVLN